MNPNIYMNLTENYSSQNVDEKIFHTYYPEIHRFVLFFDS